MFPGQRICPGATTAEFPYRTPPHDCRRSDRECRDSTQTEEISRDRNRRPKPILQHGPKRIQGDGSLCFGRPGDAIRGGSANRAREFCRSVGPAVAVGRQHFDDTEHQAAARTQHATAATPAGIAVRGLLPRVLRPPAAPRHTTTPRDVARFGLHHRFSRLRRHQQSRHRRRRRNHRHPGRR